MRAAQGAGRAVGSCARSTPGGGAFGLPAPQKRTASGLPVACATALLRSATIWLALTRSPGTAAVGRRRQWRQVWNGTLRKMACRLGDTPPHPPAPAHARCCCGLARAVPQLPPPCSQRPGGRDEVYRGSPLVWRLKVGMAASEPTMPERNCASGLQRALRSCAQVGGVGELQVAVPNWGTERCRHAAAPHRSARRRAPPLAQVSVHHMPLCVADMTIAHGHAGFSYRHQTRHRPRPPHPLRHPTPQEIRPAPAAAAAGRRRRAPAAPPPGAAPPSPPCASARGTSRQSAARWSRPPSRGRPCAAAAGGGQSRGRLVAPAGTATPPAPGLSRPLSLPTTPRPWAPGPQEAREAQADAAVLHHTSHRRLVHLRRHDAAHTRVHCLPWGSCGGGAHGVRHSHRRMPAGGALAQRPCRPQQPRRRTHR